MATEKQIAANRQNAKYSTGPRTEYGKRRSRQNAIRHGLTAETVVDVCEDQTAYKALQKAIHADYCPRSNFELQLIGRLVSLLWRLRRATAIESGILAIQANAHRKRKSARDKAIDREALEPFYQLIPTLAPRVNIEFGAQNNEKKKSVENTQELRSNRDANRFNIAQSFICLSRLNGNVIERLGRYEARLWRQTLQTILLLNSISANSNDYSDSVPPSPSLRRSMKRYRRIYWPPFCPPK
jgi:hypothetical protein